MQFNHNGKEYRLILLCLTGSRMYGNATPESDWDYRGIYMESPIDKLGIKEKEEQLGGDNKFSRSEKDENGLLLQKVSDGQEICDSLIEAGLNIVSTSDVELYEINRFVKLASRSNPNIVDILFHNTDNSIFINDYGRKILDNKDLFISKKLKDTFYGYADGQLKKIKGHNRWIAQYPDTDQVMNTIREHYKLKEIDFNWIVDNFGGKVAIKITGENAQKNISIKETISWSLFKKSFDLSDFSDKFDIENYRLPRLIEYSYPKDLKAHTMNLDENLHIVEKISGSIESRIKRPKIRDFITTEASFRTFSPTMLALYTGGKGIYSKEGVLKKNDPKEIGQFVCMLTINHNDFKKDRDHVDKMWSWKCGRNEKRGILEEKYKYDVKHASHLVRLIASAIDIAKTNNYVPELSGDRLKIVQDVRKGNYSYEWLIKYSSNANNTLIKEFSKCKLKEEPNISKIEELIEDINSKYLKDIFQDNEIINYEIH